MNIRTLFASSLVVPGILAVATPVASQGAVREADRLGGLASLPLSFEANHGQFDPRATFLARGIGYRMFLTRTGMVMSLRSAAGDTTTVRAEILGADPDAARIGLEPAAGRFHYYRGDSPGDWRADVAHFDRVRVRAILPGIDVVYYGNQKRLEYDFVVAPSADPESIQVRFRGADSMSVDAGGDLVFATGSGELRQKAPIAYQEVDGRREEVEVRFELSSPNTVGFQLGDYDASLPLVIDPILVFSTYLGSSGSEQGVRMVVDKDGHPILSGWTFSPNFPTQNAIDATLGGLDDVFVTKFAKDGKTMIFSTFVGGARTEEPGDVAVAKDGTIAVCGRTSSIDFPKKNPIFASAPAFPKAFVTVLSKTGALMFSSYVGSATRFGGENAGGVTFDDQGDLYVAGSITAANDLATAGAFQGTIAGGVDIFIARIDPRRSGRQAMKAATYVGGKLTDVALDVEIGPNGEVVVVGRSNSVDFPTRNGSQGHAGGQDAVVASLDRTLSTMNYGTYIGGSANEVRDRVQVHAGLAVDRNGFVYVCGTTGSRNFPTTPGAFDTTFKSGEAFVTKIDPTKVGAASVVFSTFIGGDATDGGQDVAVDDGGNVYVSGYTGSIATFPLVHNVFSIQSRNHHDGFLAVLDPTGARLLFSTPIGGVNGRTLGSAVAVGSGGAAFLAGSTISSSGFPTTQNAFQSQNGGGSDAFVAKFFLPLAKQTQYGTGLSGTNGEPVLSLSNPPVLGSTPDLDVTNSRGTNTQALIMIGFQKIDVPTAFGGRLLVAPTLEVMVGLPAAGTTLPVVIPSVPSASGMEAFLQCLQLDPGAAVGISFSKGLALVVGI